MHTAEVGRPETGTLRDEFPYVRVGNGPRPLVVIPGLSDALSSDERSPSPPRAAQAFFHRFRDEYAAYLIGRPRDLTVDTSIAAMAEDYGRVVEEAFGSASVLGLSMGGLIAQDLAAQRPELVDRLVVAAAGCRLSPASAPVLRRIRGYAIANDWTAVRAELVRELYDGPRRAIYPRLVSAAGRVREREPAYPSDVVVSIDAMLGYDCRSRVCDVAAPTLVVGGSRDVFFPEDVLRETAAAIPDAKLALYRGGRHGVFVEAKRGFDERVLDHLESEPEAADAEERRPEAAPSV